VRVRESKFLRKEHEKLEASSNDDISSSIVVVGVHGSH
jgi:hypothetical protein